MSQTILVVEDNPQNLELVEFLLEEEGYVVLKAMDADEAEAVLDSSQPDLVLLDMHLPGTSGLELLAKLRAKDSTRDLNVIALTAHAMRGDRERFLEGGCNGYLSKPISVATFTDDIQAFLEAAG